MMCSGLLGAAIHLLWSSLVAFGGGSRSLLATLALRTLIALVEEVLPRIIFHNSFGFVRKSARR